MPYPQTCDRPPYVIVFDPAAKDEESTPGKYRKMYGLRKDEVPTFLSREVASFVVKKGYFPDTIIVRAGNSLAEGNLSAFIRHSGPELGLPTYLKFEEWRNPNASTKEDQLKLVCSRLNKLVEQISQAGM